MVVGTVGEVATESRTIIWISFCSWIWRFCALLEVFWTLWCPQILPSLFHALIINAVSFSHWQSFDHDPGCFEFWQPTTPFCSTTVACLLVIGLSNWWSWFDTKTPSIFSVRKPLLLLLLFSFSKTQLPVLLRAKVSYFFLIYFFNVLFSLCQIADGEIVCWLVRTRTPLQSVRLDSGGENLHLYDSTSSTSSCDISKIVMPFFRKE